MPNKTYSINEFFERFAKPQEKTYSIDEFFKKFANKKEITNPFVNLGHGFAQGVVDISSGVAGTVDPQLGKAMQQQAQSDYPIAPDSILADIGRVGGNVAIMAPALLSGGGAAALGTAGLMGASSAGSGRMAVQEFEEQTGEDVSGGVETGVALGYAVAEFLPSLIGIRLQQNILRRVQPDMMRKIGDAIIGKNPGVAARYVNDVLQSAGVEGIEEGATQIFQNAISKYMYDENQEIDEGVLKAAVLGSVGGAMIGGGVNWEVQRGRTKELGKRLQSGDLAITDQGTDFSHLNKDFDKAYLKNWAEAIAEQYPDKAKDFGNKENPSRKDVSRIFGLSKEQAGTAEQRKMLAGIFRELSTKEKVDQPETEPEPPITPEITPEVPLEEEIPEPVPVGEGEGITPETPITPEPPKSETPIQEEIPQEETPQKEPEWGKENRKAHEEFIGSVGDYALYQYHDKNRGHRKNKIITKQGSFYNNINDLRVSEDIKEKLYELDNKEIQSDLDKFKQYREGPWEGKSESTVFSETIKPEFANIIKQWIKDLKISPKLFVVSKSELKNIPESRKKYNLYAAYSSIYNIVNPQKNVLGQTTSRWLGDKRYIAIDDKAPLEQQLETIAHEIGHNVYYDHWYKADPEIKKSIKKEYEKWLNKNTKPDSPLRDFIKSRLPGFTANEWLSFTSKKTFSDVNEKEYNTKFTEWFSDQVSRWANTERKPLNAVERFFKALADKIKSFYATLKGEEKFPVPPMREFLNQIAGTFKDSGLLPEEISANEAIILNILSDQPTHIDKITRETGMNAGQVSAILGQLELRDLVERGAGMQFILKSKEKPKPKTTTKKTKSKGIKKKKESPKPISKEQKLSQDEQEILNMLPTDKVIHVDKITQQLNWSVSRVSTALGILEFKGLVERESGMRFKSLIQPKPDSVQIISVIKDASGKETKDTTILDVPNKEVERQLTESYGEKGQTLSEKYKEYSQTLIHKTRSTEHLPATARFAVAKHFFRQLKNIDKNVLEDVNRELEKVLSNLKNPLEKKLFDRILIMRNLKESVSRGEPLRFGFKTIEDVDKYLDHLETIRKENPNVTESLKKRKILVDKVVTQLQDYEIVPRTMNRQHYYHQQVLQLVKGEAFGKWLTAHQKKLAIQYKRFEGQEILPEEFNYNTDWLEAERKWMTEALIELEKVKLLEQLEQKYNIKKQLKRQAKNQNYKNIFKNEKEYKLVKSLLERRAELLSDPNIGESDLKKELGGINESLYRLDPTHIHRVNIGRGIAKVIEAVETNEISEDDYYGAKNLQPSATDDLLSEQWFPFLNWIIEERPHTEAAKWAASIFKNIREREDTIKKVLGKKKVLYQTWQTLLRDRKDYTVWQPMPGNVFYPSYTIPEKIAEKIQQGLLSEMPKNELDKIKVNAVLALGGPREQYILPIEIVQQLDQLDKPDLNNPIHAVMQGAMRGWKKWTLLNPKRVAAYMLRNLTGDIDPIIAAAPGAFKEVGTSIKELWDYYYKGIDPTGDLLMARDLGVINSSMTAEEIPSWKQTKSLKRFYEQFDNENPFKKVLRKTGRYWETVRTFNEFREAIMRYAAYKYYLNHLKEETLKNYGGSNKEFVQQLKQDMGTEVAAAHLSRNLLGDYGDISVMGEYLRKHMIPFWAFQEINLRRYPNIVKNTYQAEKSKLKGIGSAGIATSVAATSALLRVGALYAAFYAWNNLMWPEEEQQLAPYDRDNPHLILGKNSNDDVITLRNVGALGDVFEWFGIGTAGVLFSPWRNGQVDSGTFLSEIAKSPIRKFLGSLGPNIKFPVEVGLGVNLFPDPLQPRTGQERGMLASNQLGLADEYKQLKGAFFGTGERARSSYYWRLIGVSNPKDSMLSEIYELRNQFLEKKGQKVNPPSGTSKFKPIRDAAKNLDYDAFKQARKHWMKQGKDFDSFIASWRSVDPIESRMNEALEQEFAGQFLDSLQRTKLQMARDYAAEIQERIWKWWLQASKEEDSTEQQKEWMVAFKKYINNKREVAFSMQKKPSESLNAYHSRIQRMRKRQTGETVEEYKGRLNMGINKREEAKEFIGKYAN